MFQQDFHAYPYQDNSPDDLGKVMYTATELTTNINPCLLYTSPSPRDCS